MLNASGVHSEMLKLVTDSATVSQQASHTWEAARKDSAFYL